MRKLPDTQRKVLAELAAGTGLFRRQQYAWGPIRYMLGDKVVAPGTVATLAMGGLIRPARRVEIGDPLIPYELTEKGRAALAQTAA